MALDILAEQEGFEPSIRETRIPDFESGAFDHSATAPGLMVSLWCEAQDSNPRALQARPPWSLIRSQYDEPP